MKYKERVERTYQFITSFLYSPHERNAFFKVIQYISQATGLFLLTILILYSIPEVSIPKVPELLSVALFVFGITSVTCMVRHIQLGNSRPEFLGHVGKIVFLFILLPFILLGLLLGTLYILHVNDIVKTPLIESWLSPR